MDLGNTIVYVPSRKPSASRAPGRGSSSVLIRPGKRARDPARGRRVSNAQWRRRRGTGTRRRHRIPSTRRRGARPAPRLTPQGPRRACAPWYSPSGGAPRPRRGVRKPLLCWCPRRDRKAPSTPHRPPPPKRLPSQHGQAPFQARPRLCETGDDEKKCRSCQSCIRNRSAGFGSIRTFLHGVRRVQHATRPPSVIHAFEALHLLHGEQGGF